MGLGNGKPAAQKLVGFCCKPVPSDPRMLNRFTLGVTKFQNGVML